LASRLHVLKIPTKDSSIFPYTHFSDKDHDPYIVATKENGYLILTCTDLFKLKPNVQVSPKNRVDLYMPYSSAIEIGNLINEFFGSGNLAQPSYVNPEMSRKGPQTLPLIDETRTVKYAKTQMNIAECKIEGKHGTVYIDREKPNEGHIEMKGREIHFGIPLQYILGSINESLVSTHIVPEEEVRVEGEENPVRKSQGTLKIAFTTEEAKKLASTLLFLGNIQE
jgi:hypothetical protein